jgi:hypothetical protein
VVKRKEPELQFVISAPGGNLISAPDPQHCYMDWFFMSTLLSVTKKSDQDPDPYGCALVWIPGSVSTLKRVRIRNLSNEVRFEPCRITN